MRRFVDVPAAAAHDVDGWCSAVNESDRRFLIGLQIANSRVMTMDVWHGLELDPPVKHRFAELITPISVLVGARDFDGTQLWARRLAAQAPNANLEILPDADHMPMFSTPAAFRAFVTRVSAE